jgi:mono/diheme cytochrome c family protein
MLAMGGAFTKTDGRPGVKDPSSATDTTGEKHDLFRTPWYDEPDCGSCHTGKGQSAVLKTAFDPLQPAQMSFKPDLTDPDQSRFAVTPRVQKTMTIRATKPYNLVTQAFESFDEELKIDAPVFRAGKDTHGNVACAACHGAAHAIWPNRDPKANDNVTALQLQGHTGTLLECNVCHDKDSFKNETDLDGSALYSGDPKAGILGGPHNTHPVNDPFWYQKAGDGGNGGWHNNYASKSGRNGEDQCAACHGADHKGTRLSKTPVDRVFKVMVKNKAKTVKVAAGAQIGCNLCHDIGMSFPQLTPKSVAALPVTPGSPAANVAAQPAQSGPSATDGAM